MELAKKYCQGEGLEIGGSFGNAFPDINVKNVDLGDKSWEFYKEEQIKESGDYMPIDIRANGDEIPVEDDSQDFVINSHVIEHFENPIKALIEWDRITKVGGYIFIIAPHKERTFDKEKNRTKLYDVVQKWENGTPNNDHSKHFGIWITKDLINIINWMIAQKLIDWEFVKIEDQDSKIGNGFTIVCKKLENQNVRERIKTLEE